MSTIITIRVLGLAACFYRQPYWNVVFVCDNVHPLDFMYPEGSGVGSASLHETGRDLEIAFHSPSVGPAPNPYENESGRLFNMAADYAHGPNTLRIERRRKITDLAWMKVPTSVFGVSRTTDRQYYVQEQNFPGAPVKIIDPVAKDVVLTFGIEDNLTMAVTDPKDPSYNREFKFDASGGNIDLDFDNDCHNKCTHNDFLDLYEFVIDGDENQERQFAAGQVEGDIPNAQPNGLKLLGGVMSPEQGNCDPSGIMPAPPTNDPR